MLVALAAVAGPAQPPSHCRVPGLKQEVLCGQVERALDPARPEGPRIAVHYVLVPAAARNKQPDPVFFLAGGPGQSATQLAGSAMTLFSRLNNRRDIVFVDQRGTGRSAPLVCADDGQLKLDEQFDPKAQLARLARCRAQLQRLPHGDLRYYTTTLAMADADAVREALGAPQVNLVGGSYGTRAALEYLRQFPARVRRLVIDGVAPPDMVLPESFAVDNQAALDAGFAACEAEPACRQRHPRLRARWREFLAALPRRVSANDPLSGEAVSLQLTRDAVASALRAPLYAPAVAAALPYAMAEAVEGRYTPLLGLPGALGGPRGLKLAGGMHFSVICSEDYPRMQRAQAGAGGDFGSMFADLYREACRDWPRGAVPEAFYRMPSSAAPALVFSGGLDPVTPPRHGERAVAALGPKAQHVVVPHAGHGILAIGCTRDVVYRFIDAERDEQAQQVDAACVRGVPRPPLFEPWRPKAGGAEVAQ